MATLGSKSEGSIIKLKENGVLVEFYVAKHNYESGLNGSGRTLLVRKDCYDQRAWHSSNVNAYASSTIDTWLNSTYKTLLDVSIRTAMGTTKIYYTPSNGNNSVSTLQRSVFLLSATELSQSHTYMNTEGTALTIASTLKKAYLNGSAYSQWTRSPFVDGAYGAWHLYASGDLDHSSCSIACGARPAFTLPASLTVNNDGTVTTNTAPGTPASISVPSSIRGGTSITISWGSSTDSEGNLEGYIVERSTNGGSSWTQIYQGSSRSTTNTVSYGTSTVMYRVRAYDSEGLYSGYKTSSNVTVINNSAPGAPSSITVPTAVAGGGTLTVSWGASSDSDGNLSGYVLERQANGGSWTQVYKGSARSYTDTVTAGWSTVAYRVRAYDTYSDYSSYTTSPTRTVTNNTAPVIACDTPTGSNLGTRNDGFDFTYTVTDADNDAVTVKEYLDNTIQRSYTAVLGQPNAFQAVTAANFQTVLNGAHTLKAAANDGTAETVHSLAFTKNVTSASVTLEAPMEADAPISVCILSVLGSIPADAQYTVEVTNNALDDTPVWETCTAAVKAGVNYVFSNKAAAHGFAFNFRLEVERGPSGQGGCITSIQGGFQ